MINPARRVRHYLLWVRRGAGKQADSAQADAQHCWTTPQGSSPTYRWMCHSETTAPQRDRHPRHRLRLPSPLIKTEHDFRWNHHTDRCACWSRLARIDPANSHSHYEFQCRRTPLPMHFVRHDDNPPQFQEFHRFPRHVASQTAEALHR